MPSEAAHVAVGVAEVEQIAALGWRGLDEARLGGWLLRAADGFTGRANSALALGGAPPAAGWLPELVRWYAERGLPPMVQVPLPGAEAIDAVLAEAGWRTHDLVRFLTGDIAEIQKSTAQSVAQRSAGRPVSDPLAPGVLHSTGSEVIARLDAEPDAAWLATYHYRGAALPGHARDVLVRAGVDTELSFASLRAPAPDGAPGAVLAVARAAVTHGWLGLTAVTVADQHRRQGHGTRLMSELACWAAERGGRSIYLQVASDNAAALRLYEQLGFHHHHDYRYRIGPAPEG
ncbi:MAG: GNAT family N-acetyltransferase [Geodermatophilaceae bacterium]|nr:GNAT family N-acetyltransferase [Geodermatophilaceae bacterium]